MDDAQSIPSRPSRAPPGDELAGPRPALPGADGDLLPSHRCPAHTPVPGIGEASAVTADGLALLALPRYRDGSLELVQQCR